MKSSSPELVRRAFQRRWWLVLAVAGLAVVTAAVVTHTLPPRFRASAWLVVTPNPEIGDATDALRSLDALDRRSIIATLAQIPSTPDMRKASARELDWEVEKLEGYQIQASVVTGTNVIKIDVVGDDAEMVAEAAAEVARLTAKDGQSMYPMYVLRLLVEPVAPEKPFLPDRKRNYSLALLIGLFLGLMAALGAEYVQGFAASPPPAEARHLATPDLTKNREEDAR